jgi:hypothetical protein
MNKVATPSRHGLALDDLRLKGSLADRGSGIWTRRTDSASASGRYSFDLRHDIPPARTPHQGHSGQDNEPCTLVYPQ